MLRSEKMVPKTSLASSDAERAFLVTGSAGVLARETPGGLVTVVDAGLDEGIWFQRLW